MSDTSQEIRTAGAAGATALDDSATWPDLVEELVERAFPSGAVEVRGPGDLDPDSAPDSGLGGAVGPTPAAESGEIDPLEEVLVSAPDFHRLVLRASEEFDEDSVDQLDDRSAEFGAEQELLALILDERWGPRTPVHSDPAEDCVSPRIAEALDVAREYVDAWVLEERVVLLGVSQLDDLAPFELCVAVVKRSGHVSVPLDEMLWPEFIEELLLRGFPADAEHHLVRLRAGAALEDLPSDGHRARQRRECLRWHDDLADELEELWGPGLPETDRRLTAVLRRFPDFGDDPGEVDAWVRTGRIVLIGVAADELAPLNLLVLVIPAKRFRS